MWLRILLTILVFDCTAQTAELPDWVISPPHQDEYSFYYLGYSGTQQNASDAYQRAYEMARDLALRQIFGVEVTIHKSAISTLAQSQEISLSDEKINSVNLVGFELFKQFSTKNAENLDEAYLLFKYPKKSALLEVKRLAKLNARKMSSKLFSPSNLQNLSGTLNIQTIPNGAQVLIDEQPWGRTNLSAELPAGQHRLRLSHPYFKPIQKMVHVFPGKLAKLDLILPPGTAELRVSSNLPGTKYSLMDTEIKAYEWILLEAGKKYILKAENEAAITEIREILLENDQNLDLEFKLTLKPVQAPQVTSPSPLPATKLSVTNITPLGLSVGINTGVQSSVYQKPELNLFAWGATFLKQLPLKSQFGLGLSFLNAEQEFKNATLSQSIINFDLIFKKSIWQVSTTGQLVGVLKAGISKSDLSALKAESPGVVLSSISETLWPISVGLQYDFLQIAISPNHTFSLGVNSVATYYVGTSIFERKISPQLGLDLQFRF